MFYRLLGFMLTTETGREFECNVSEDDPFISSIQPFLKNGLVVKFNSHFLNVRELSVLKGGTIKDLATKIEQNNTLFSEPLELCMKVLMLEQNEEKLYEFKLDGVVIRDIDLLKISNKGCTVNNVVLELPYGHVVSFFDISADEEDE